MIQYTQAMSEQKVVKDLFEKTITKHAETKQNCPLIAKARQKALPPRFTKSRKPAKSQ